MPTPRRKKPTPTAIPTPAPISAFVTFRKVVNLRGDLAHANPITDAVYASNWKVLESAHIVVTVERNSDTVPLSDYTFNLMLRPDSTGIYFDGTKSASCYSGKEAATESGFLSYFERDANSVHVYFDAIRCGIGDNNNRGLSVVAKAPDGSLITLNTGSVPQAAHRHKEGGPPLVYRIFPADISGSRPGYMTERPNIELQKNLVSAADTGRLMWGYQNGRALFRVMESPPDGGAEISISWYWAGSPPSGCSRASLACAATRYGDSHASGDTEIKLSYPPRGEYDAGVSVTEWTLKYDRAIDSRWPGRYSYLPSIVGP